MSAVHTTNYVDTFIAVAPDSTAAAGVEPPAGANPSAAARSYALIAPAPYARTSDDVLFTVWADRHGVPAEERDAARAAFFAKGQPCLRSSDLGKRYGWGVHFDARGRIALYGVNTPEYEAFAAGVSPLDGAQVTVRQAMRTSRGPTS